VRSSHARIGKLRPSKEVVRVLREGTALSSGRVVVYVAPGAGKSRAAWIAGRKVGSAVARNRARRLLREAWAALGPEVREGTDVVMVARAAIRGAKAQDVVEEVARVLVRVGVMAR
jgi:ribonuclease P protein component